MKQHNLKATVSFLASVYLKSDGIVLSKVYFSFVANVFLAAKVSLVAYVS
jgi:hypothetical protein